MNMSAMMYQNQRKVPSGFFCEPRLPDVKRPRKREEVTGRRDTTKTILGFVS
jgi:hypothetical protein